MTTKRRQTSRRPSAAKSEWQHRFDAEEREARQLQIEAHQMQTDRLRQQNAASSRATRLRTNNAVLQNNPLLAVASENEGK